MKIKQVALAAVGVSAVCTVVAAGIAQADPSGSPAQRVLAGEGSDTTQGVMDGLSNAILSNGSNYINPQTLTPVASGTKVIASYSATGTSGFTSKTGTNPFTGSAYTCTFAGNPTPDNSVYVDGDRANGSGNGYKALESALTSGDATANCIDFARASSTQTGLATATTDIPFAIDAVTFAVTNSTQVGRQLALADLKAIYSCTFGTSGGIKETTVTALLPQAGSGTRKFWEAALGITDSQVGTTALPCVTDSKNYETAHGFNSGNDANGNEIGWGDVHGTANVNPLEEHDGRFLSDTSIMPLSVAQYAAQTEGVLQDLRGNEVPGQVDGDNAILENSSLGVPQADKLVREVYNIVPKNMVGSTVLTGAAGAEQTNIKQAFVGSTSDVCSQTQVIQQFGFALDPNCGSTSTSE